MRSAFSFRSASQAALFTAVPDFTAGVPQLTQSWQNKDLPVLITRYSAPIAVIVQQRARSFVDPRWLQFLRYIPAESRLEINQNLGPVFDKSPDHYGMYGNGSSADPDFYLAFNPYSALRPRSLATLMSRLASLAINRPAL